MAETAKKKTRRVRHADRVNQVVIYLGKQLRFFINENDWKVLPMAAIIAALVGMVIRERLFVNMEGSLIGGFALTCVAIWNGCFNSIQSVCRERPIIKREHRSGMHVSAYMAAHMIYQLLLCLAQTGLTIYVLIIMDVPFPGPGVITPFMMVDIGLSMLLISYASDMMSLFMSSISHTTTGAMTLMPFVLIFQLVFSGGLIPLPAWSQQFSNFTISNYGIKAIVSQSGYNELPMNTGWSVLSGMKDQEMDLNITVGQLLDALDTPTVEKRRDQVVLKSFTRQEALALLKDVGENLDVLNQPVVEGVTLGQALGLLQVQTEVTGAGGQAVNEEVTLGRVVDFLKGSAALQQKRDQTFSLKMTVGDVFDLVGRDNLKAIVEKKTAEASYKAEYDCTPENVWRNWFMLILFILVFAALATISLELIDKDKR